MSLPYLIIILFSITTVILTLFLGRSGNKAKKLKEELEKIKKQNSYKENLIKEIQACIEYGKTLECIVKKFVENLDKNFPYSTLSSTYITTQKIYFDSIVKEKVNKAFIDHIKDLSISALSNAEKDQKEIAENIQGLPPEEIGSSQILSSIELHLTVKDRTIAVINMASTSPDLYKEEDIKNLSSIAELISDFLTNMESQLHIEKSKSLAMIDSFSEGIFMVDKNENLVAMNNSAENFLNIHKKIPTINDVYSALPNTYNFKEKISKVISENKQIIEEDVPLHTKSLQIIITPVLEISNNQNLPPGQNNVIGASVLLHDTTIEKSLAQMKEDFTNIMVHELRSPLTAIKASSEFLHSRADLTPSEKQQLTKMISDSSKKMLDKIALILDGAKMDAGLFTIKKTPSDLTKLLKDRVEVFSPVASEKSINLSVEIDPNLPTFSFDPIRVDEVVNNLLSNSLKFTPTGGTISLKANQSPGLVTVSVSDTGAGIPKDKQSKLFSKYTQAPTDGQHVGTGLGLYVVKGVIDSHGGKITLESNDGKDEPDKPTGTTISFTLPVDGQAFTANPAPTTHPSPDPQRLVN